jgi:hypothetical protein
MALFSVLGASPAALSSRPASSFIHGSRSAPKSSKRGASSRAATSLSVRCEQGAKQGGGVWLGRAAMIGFASAIAVEVSTGKGFLEVLLHCTSPFVQFSASWESVMQRQSKRSPYVLSWCVQNFGVATPAPTLALVVSGLVVGLAVFFLLQSGSQDWLDHFCRVHSQQLRRCDVLFQIFPSHAM